MENKKRTGFSWEYAAAFVLPILIMMAVFAALGFAPFGKTGIMASDLRAQYYDLMVNVVNKLKTGENLFVTHEVGFGENLYAWIAYILFDPINIIFMFFDKAAYDSVFLCIILFKLGLAGMFASVFFKKSGVINTKGLPNVAFSVLYALGIFNIAVCGINIMWLGNVALLPICCLGVERIVKKNRIDLFAATYLLCVLTNYYLAYITGITCFLYFIYAASVWNTAPENMIKPLLKILLAAALALGISAFMLVPTALAVKSGYFNMFETASSAGMSAFSLGQASRALLLIADEKLSLLGNLDVFFGTVPVVLTVAFLFTNGTTKRERITAACISVLFAAALFVGPLYIMLHFMRKPTGFEGRYAYAMAFMYIVFTLRMLKNEKRPGKAALIIPVVFVILALNAALKNESTIWYLLDSAAVLIITVICCVSLAAEYKVRKKLFSGLVLAEAVCMAAGGMYIMKKNYVFDKVADRAGYEDSVGALTERINSGDEGYFRSVNAGLGGFGKFDQPSAGYNSIRVFSSLAHQKANAAAGHLGVAVYADNKALDTKYNSIVSDSIFNVKYVFIADKQHAESDDNGRKAFPSAGRLSSDAYECIYEDETSEIYENKKVFPLMFAADKDVIGCGKEMIDERLNFGAVCKNQEVFLNALTGRKDTLYYGKVFDGGDLHNCTIEDAGAYKVLKLNKLPEGSEVAQNEDELGTLTYSFKVDEPGEYFTNLWFINGNKDLENNISYAMMINGVSFIYNGLPNGFLYELGAFEKGDDINIKIISGKKELEMMEPLLLKFDKKAFYEIADEVRSRGLKNIEETGGDLRAESDFDEDNFIFTTLNYDEGFHIYIDGAETAKIKAADAFLGFELPKGKHEVFIKYVSPGFGAGVCISVLSVLALLISIAAENIMGKEKKYVEEDK